MPRPIVDETGNRYGRLVVMRASVSRGEAGHVKWYCRCDCGNYKTVSANRLRAGEVKSCGCLRTTAGKLAHKEWLAAHG